MSELRWNPQLRQWVIVATHRQDRTHNPPAEFCPLCPTLPGAFPTEVPAEDYEIVVFQNKFPALSQPPPELEVEGSQLYPVGPSEGVCEVVLYSSKHDGSLADLDEEHIENLIEVWTDRYNELGSKETIEYVYIFENKGEPVGVTLSHPHGQIYAMPFIPPLIKTELESAKEHNEKTGNCLYCDILKEERKDKSRIITENEEFTAFVPFFARFPFEVHIYPKRHLQSFADFSAKERAGLAQVLKRLLRKYDNLFGFSLPYIMAIHQGPTKGDYPEYHFHFEFYPLNRSDTKLKYLAGAESGAGTFVTDMSPEKQAKTLRGEKGAD